MDRANLLRHWRFRVHRVQTGHYEAGRRYEQVAPSVFPAIAVSALVGTAVFSSLATEKNGVMVTILSWPTQCHIRSPDQPSDLPEVLGSGGAPQTRWS